MRALIAIDLTEDEGDFADDLQESRAWLERAGATVDLLFVEPTGPMDLGRVSGADREELGSLLTAAVLRRDQEVQERLDGLLAAWPAERRGLGHLSHESRVADEITRRASDYDLVVVGTHGRRGLTRAWLGSVAEKVVRGSPVPVLVMRGHALAAGLPILAAVDGWDPGAEKIVDEAARWAARIGSTVDLLHILTVQLVPDPTTLAVLPSARELDTLFRDADRQLVTLAERVPTAVRGPVRVTWGDPAASLCAAARDHGLVVVGTHGRAGLGRLWLGSVAERVVRRSPAPVLVVPTRP